MCFLVGLLLYTSYTHLPFSLIAVQLIVCVAGVWVIVTVACLLLLLFWEIQYMYWNVCIYIQQLLLLALIFSDDVRPFCECFFFQFSSFFSLITTKFYNLCAMNIPPIQLYIFHTIQIVYNQHLYFMYICVCTQCIFLFIRTRINENSCGNSLIHLQ